MSDEYQFHHKDVCIAVNITDYDGEIHRFEAVGFMSGEGSIKIKQAFRRAGQRVVKSDEHWRLIKDNLDQLPDELSRYVWLGTLHPDSRFEDGISCLILRDGSIAWATTIGDIDQSCNEFGLVLRVAEPTTA